MTIMEAHIDIQGKTYPDSVVCDFKLLVNTIRVVSANRCSSNSIEYRDVIPTKEVKDQAMSSLLPMIGSSYKKSPIVLMESHIGNIFNAVKRGLFPDVEYIR